MKLSQTGMGTTKLNNIDEMYPGQSILLQTGQLVQYGAGLFGYNTVPLLVRRKVEQIIVETLNKYGCIEVLLPTLQPDTIWKNSGRYEHYTQDGTMLITESNKGTFCLAPTGEEAMLEFAREKLKSYKNLPVTFYQIGEKYRNEISTRGYLLRGKAFPMLDAYSFDVDEEAMAEALKSGKVNEVIKLEHNDDYSNMEELKEIDSETIANAIANNNLEVNDLNWNLALIGNGLGAGY